MNAKAKLGRIDFRVSHWSYLNIFDSLWDWDSFHSSFATKLLVFHSLLLNLTRNLKYKWWRHQETILKESRGFLCCSIFPFLRHILLDALKWWRGYRKTPESEHWNNAKKKERGYESLKEKSNNQTKIEREIKLKTNCVCVVKLKISRK